MLNCDYQEDLSNINLITLDDIDHDDDSDQLKKRILAENRNFRILFPNNFLNLQQQRPHYHDEYTNFNKLIKQKHHRSSLGLAVDSSSFNNSNCAYGNDIRPPTLHIGQNVWNRCDLETPQYGSMIDLSINGRHWLQREMDNEGENLTEEDASNPRKMHHETGPGRYLKESSLKNLNQ
uniref:Uncharacterized protein n=1 Tax=Romanomermis culicivorax TaxID=13658 RepID=A0A915JDI0_ROMCU